MIIEIEMITWMRKYLRPPLVQRCGLHPIPNGSVLDGGDWFFLHGWGVGCSDRRHGWGRRNEHVQLHKTESQNLLKITYLRDKIKWYYHKRRYTFIFRKIEISFTCWYGIICFIYFVNLFRRVLKRIVSRRIPYEREKRNVILLFSTDILQKDIALFTPVFCIARVLAPWFSRV